VETPLAGAYTIDLDRIEDDRGFFARSFCAREFAALGLDEAVVQCNVSFNHRVGTLRGMHYQAEPYGEAKLVRCTMGRILDVIVDIRLDSPTRGRWFSTELSAENHRMLFIPRGFAHGFQTLVDNSEVFYQMSALYEPSAARGLRWDDPVLAIDWPIAGPIVSERDRAYPLVGHDS
jgi:dTDP-4-dehydrorhamnose 3,5-epimerase